MKRPLELAALTMLVGLAATLALGGVLFVDIITSPRSPIGTVDYRPLLVCLALTGLSGLSYLVWFSRWNVVAHTQLVFAVVAYVVPILGLHQLDTLSSAALTTYYQVCGVGFVMAFIGTFIGAGLASPKLAERLVDRWPFDSAHRAQVERRTRTLALGSIGAVAVSFMVMGFVPALTPDPLVAKFFRGPYAEAYAPVAPLYRAGTTFLTFMLPLIGFFAWKRRSTLWVGILTGALGVLLLGLLRESAVSGLLLLLGVFLAARGRGLVLYFVLLVSAYFAGAALYSALSALGVPGYGGVQGASLLAKVAAGAPDVNDQLSFLRAWLMHPEYTHGLTWVGGLVPGNFRWNPSVWTLTTVNPGVPISQIASGGLRLPAPIWGFVSFGWWGALGVSFAFGVVSGFLAKLFARLVQGRNLSAALCWIVLYAALLDVAPVFFRLGYLSVMQLVFVFWLLRLPRATPDGAPTRHGGNEASARRIHGTHAPDGHSRDLARRR